MRRASVVPLRQPPRVPRQRRQARLAAGGGEDFLVDGELNAWIDRQPNLKPTSRKLCVAWLRKDWSGKTSDQSEGAVAHLVSLTSKSRADKGGPLG